MPVMNVGPNRVVIRDGRIFVCHLLCSNHTAAAGAVVPYELFDAQVSQVLVTKHVLLCLRQEEAWVRVVWVLRHVRRISWAGEFTWRDELGTDEDTRLCTSHHVEPQQSGMRDAYSHCTTFQEVFDSVPCAFHVIPWARSDTSAV